MENLRPVFPPVTWSRCESRIERNTESLLDLFDVHRIQATFFVLGCVAKRFSSLIRQIQSRGHEIASHGYNHQLCTELSGQDLLDDLVRSKVLLEDTIGQRVFGYRAPSFSITSELLKALSEAGYRYDSSYNNFDYNKRYGRINGSFSSDGSHRLISANGIFEIPLSNLRFAGRNLSWAGGGFFRFWPTLLFEAGVSKILSDRGLYVFYCHPWEIDPGQPRVENTIGWVNRFRHYCNLDKTLDRLGHFLRSFKNREFMLCSRFVGLD